jgi:predicted ribonuclease YlaK
MAKSNSKTNNKNDAPKDLNKHPFYGLILDEEQKIFRDAIWDPEKLVVFCNAKAGTGKTLIATATADLLVQYGRYDGIVYISSPTQEGKLGYLPGEIADKVAIYSEPFLEALIKLDINPNTAIHQYNILNQKNGESYIDVTTHVYLRGCNFENKVVILDETQNYYTDELKKTLTRMSDNCKVIIIGHSGQVDLYHNPENSGFVRYLNHFKDDPRTAICELTTNHRGWISSHADELE